METSKRIVIGNEVLIGCGCYIKSGIKIGTGANSVVTHDVKPYTIVADVPA